MSRLPLTLIEQYFLAEDQPAYPSWVFIRLRLHGVIDRRAFEAAWRKVRHRHPTLHAVIRDRGPRAPDWESLEEACGDAGFVWHDAPRNATSVPWVPLDPRRTPAVRLVVHAQAETYDVSLEGHHALFDGMGALAVAHDLLLGYARSQGAPVDLSPLRPDLWPQRGRFGLNWWSRLKLAPTQLLGLWFAREMQSRPVAPLVPHAFADLGGAPPAGFPAMLHRTLDATRLAQLHVTAKKHGATLNDLFIRDLQAAIGVWRSHAKIGEDTDWIHVAIPVNLRRPEDAALPAANVLGLVAIDRRARSLTNRARLLRRASEDMTLVKRHRLGFTFLLQLALLRRRRGGIARFSAAPRCRATVVLTNLGQVWAGSSLQDKTGRVAVPGAVVEDVAIGAPCRRGTCACAAVSTYAGRLKIDLHFDPRVLRPEQAESFLETLLDQFELSAHDR